MGLFDRNVSDPKSLQEVEQDRVEIGLLLGQYEEVLGKLSRVLGRNGVGTHELGRATDFYKDGKVDHEKVLKEVDGAMWAQVIETTGVTKLMTSQDAMKLREKVRDTPTPFSAKAALSLVARSAASTESLVRDSVRKIFDSLTSKKFRPGNTWRAEERLPNKRQIEASFRLSLFWGGLPEYWYGGGTDHAAAYLNDLELLCLLCDGKVAVDYPNRLGDRMAEAYRLRGELTAETPYFQVQLFKNGNAKVYFTRTDILERANAWGADGTKISEEA